MLNIFTNILSGALFSMGVYYLLNYPGTIVNLFFTVGVFIVGSIALIIVKMEKSLHLGLLIAAGLIFYTILGQDLPAGKDFPISYSIAFLFVASVLVIWNSWSILHRRSSKNL